MPVKSAPKSARRSRSKPGPRRKATKPARRGWLVASVGGLSAVGMLCFAGCTAVLAGAAAGMLASSTGSGNGTITTPTVGDTVDSAADAAGQVLARTIKSTVPASVRSAPAGMRLKASATSSITSCVGRSFPWASTTRKPGRGEQPCSGTH